MGQQRLTLPPTQQAPESANQQRPPSGYFIQQYAYKSPATPQQQQPPASYQPAHSGHPPVPQYPAQPLEPPYQATGRPPVSHSSSKFKPAPSSDATQSGNTGHPSSSRMQQNENLRLMGPPPTPQHVRQQKSSLPTNSYSSGSRAQVVPVDASGLSRHSGRTYINSARQPWSNAAPQRFAPPATPVNSSGPQLRSYASESRQTSRTLPTGGGQRMPFNFSGDKNGGTFG